MTEVTGMNFIMDENWHKSEIKLIADSPLAKGMAADKLVFKTKEWYASYFRNRDIYKEELSPVFWPADKDIEIAGRYSGNGQPGLFYKDFGSWKSVYCGLPYMPRAVLRNVAKMAGVHIYLEDPDAYLHANGDFISIHNGKKKTETTLNLKKTRKIYDAFEGTFLKKSGSMKLMLEPGETKLLMIE
jgi:hypothetical protein